MPSLYEDDSYEYYYDWPIHRATAAGDFEAVDFMLKRGDSPNVWVMDSHGAAPLHIAIMNGRADIVRLLLRHGADSEDSYRASFDGSRPNSTPLTMAIELGDAEVVRALTTGGADPNAPNDRGDHPLSLAIRLKDTEIICALLDAPALDINAPDGGGIPGIFRLIAAGEQEAAARLLELGAEPDVCLPGSGSTALHEAARRGQSELAELLLLYGANPLARNARGELPCDLAKQRPRILELLGTAAAKRPKP